MTCVRHPGARRRLAQSAAAILLGLAGCTSAANEGPLLAATHSCPQWVDFPADAHGNAGSPYLGCTNLVNLQNMLDRPSDLDRGRQLGAASGEREAIGVETYQQGKIRDFTNANAPQPVFFAPGGSSQ